MYELGLRRLREELGLEPVEYPTTRVLGADPRDRARDLTAAFADPTITAVLATVGGDDLITVTPHLDDAVLRANPKPYFGYSDNTNVLNHLYRLGIVAYHGGSVLVHLGRPGRPHPLTFDSLRAALFTSGWYDLAPAAEWGDRPNPWSEPETLAYEPEMLPGEGWRWQGPARVVQGRTWGGCLEIVHWLLATGRVPSAEELAGSILVFETSNELPTAQEVFRIVRNLGERGCSPASRRSSSAGPRHGTSASRCRCRSGWRGARRSGTRSPERSTRTPRTRWWSSTSTSATPTHN
ncbi:hypothetical protein GCM10027614_38120 [Micromonospora vulcania]